MNFLLALVCCTFISLYSSLEIRHAQPSDLDAIIALDTEVTYEFFKPLYLNHYVDFAFGKNPDPWLEDELISDKLNFPSYIHKYDNKRLYVALIHTEKGTELVGLLTCHQDDEDELYLDLFLIDTRWRRHGIGRGLIQYAIDDNPTCQVCVVEPLKYGNGAALSFYESLGFTRYVMPDPDRISAYDLSYDTLYYHYRLLLK